MSTSYAYIPKASPNSLHFGAQYGTTNLLMSAASGLSSSATEYQLLLHRWQICSKIIMTIEHQNHGIAI